MLGVVLGVIKHILGSEPQRCCRAAARQITTSLIATKTEKMAEAKEVNMGLLFALPMMKRHSRSSQGCHLPAIFPARREISQGATSCSRSRSKRRASGRPPRCSRSMRRRRVSDGTAWGKNHADNTRDPRGSCLLPPLQERARPMTSSLATSPTPP